MCLAGRRKHRKRTTMPHPLRRMHNKNTLSILRSGGLGALVEPIKVARQDPLAHRRRRTLRTGRPRRERIRTPGLAHAQRRRALARPLDGGRVRRDALGGCHRDRRPDRRRLRLPSRCAVSVRSMLKGQERGRTRSAVPPRESRRRSPAARSSWCGSVAGGEMRSGTPGQAVVLTLARRACLGTFGTAKSGSASSARYQSEFVSHQTPRGADAPSKTAGPKPRRNGNVVGDLGDCERR
jgi:hypothetical protein